MTTDKKVRIIKWWACVICAIAVGLTSFNIYPVNVIVAVAGTGLWFIAGVLSRDIPLYLGEILHLVLYIAGLITYLIWLPSNHHVNLNLRNCYARIHTGSRKPSSTSTPLKTNEMACATTHTSYTPI